MSASIPFDKVLIRTINTTTQKVKNVFPAIANNKGLMRNMGFVISDPNYEAKMDAIKNKKAFSENGQAIVPAQESFAPKVEPVKEQPAIVTTKSEAPITINNEIVTPVIEGEPKTKRTRRTKAQIEADKLTEKQTA